jgi:endoglucanase
MNLQLRFTLMTTKIIEDRSGLKKGLSKILAITPLSIKYIVIPMIVFSFIIASFPYRAHAATSVGVWWPVDGAHVTNVQPFKALLDGMSVDQYDMYWQVDGGALVTMPSSYNGYPHKETMVNIAGWTWKGKGPYAVTFVAKAGGAVIGQRTVNIYNDGATAVAQAQSVTVAPTTTSTTQAQQTQIASTPTQTTVATTQVQTQPAPTPSVQTTSIEVWWPTAQAKLNAVTPFKALAKNMSVDTYDMYWQIPGTQPALMPTNNADYPHKEVTVDVSKWTGGVNGTYTITFTAKNKNGNVVATRQIPVTVNAPAAQTTVVVAPPAPVITTTAPVTTTPVPVTNTQISTSGLYVNPNSPAASQANAWRTSRPADARAMDLLAAQPTAVWFGGWNANIYNDVQSLVQRAASAGKTPVLIAYNIPQRDCGGYSAGGVGSPEAYRTWISSIASAIGNNKAIVILEPDALSGITCLSGADQQTRMGLLSGAISTLKNNPNTLVYLDAGHSAWVDVNTMASRLQSANVARADGFALNVSNFRTTSESTTYGTQISQKLGGKHFIIDTARNGLGSSGEWCNPGGRAIGQKPTLQTGNALIDAYLWLKVPGESDGNCNGGPSAGQWWGDYALGLVQRSTYTY